MKSAIRKANGIAISYNNFSLDAIRSEWVGILVLMSLCTVIIFANFGGWDLWHQDETRYAEVVREMIATSNYLVPHLNGEVYPDKPPLFFWIITFFSRLSGEVTTSSARLPSALAALAVLLLTYLLGRKLYGPLTGFLAGLILFTTTEFFWLALRANIDMMLTLWTTMALFCFYGGYTAKHRQQVLYLLAYCCMGFAVLTKGPVGLLIPLITITVFLVVKRDFDKFRQIGLGKGSLIVLGIVAAWLIPACLTGGEAYTQNILFKQNLGRMVDSYSHRAPFFYYLLNFPLDFLPWSLLIPGAAIYFCKQKKKRESLHLCFPLAWFLGNFVFFSFVSGKRNLYLLPVYPSAALIMAKFWCDSLLTNISGSGQISRKFYTIPFYLLFGGLVLISITMLVLLAIDFPLNEHLQTAWRATSIYPVLGIMGIGGILGIIFTGGKNRLAVPLGLLTAIMLGGFLFAVLSVFPLMNASKSAKPFCGSVAAIVGPEDQLITFRFEPETFNYFLQRVPIPQIDDPIVLKSILQSPDKVYCLIEEKYYRQAPEADKKIVTVLLKGEVGRRSYYLLVNRTAGPGVGEQLLGPPNQET